MQRKPGDKYGSVEDVYACHVHYLRLVRIGREFSHSSTLTACGCDINRKLIRATCR